ncbi:hypothetical protein M8J77_020038 [Diaphorina citri]|nr:hypothetical protein M8J77_020038 [Diaphorina citri]
MSSPDDAMEVGTGTNSDTSNSGGVVVNLGSRPGTPNSGGVVTTGETPNNDKRKMEGKRKMEESPRMELKESQIGLMRLIEDLEKKVQELSALTGKHENTKVEIKQASKCLNILAYRLSIKKGELYEIYEEKIKEKQMRLESSPKPPRAQNCAACGKKIAEEEEKTKKLKEDLDKLGSILDVDEFIEKAVPLCLEEWKDEFYQEVTIKKGVVESMKGKMVVFIGEGDESSPLVGIIQGRYADVEDIIKQGGEEMEFLENVTRTKYGVSSSKLYLAKIGKREKRKTIIKKIIEMMEGEKEGRIDLALTERLDWVYTRKVLELVSRKYSQRTVSLVVPNSYRPEGEKREKIRASNIKLKLATNSENQGNLNEIMRDLKKQVALNEEGITIESVKGNTTSYEIRAKEKREGALKEFMEEVGKKVGARAEVSMTTTTGGITNLIVRGIESSTEQAEIVPAIRALLPEGIMSDGVIRLSSLRPNYRKDAQVAKISASREVADILLTKKQVKIGWVSCPIELLVEPLQCYKCLKHGHRSANCKNEETINGKCRRCLGEGHIAKDCIVTPKCADCGGSHNTGVMACEIFRTMVNESREERTTKIGLAISGDIDLCLVSEPNDNRSKEWGGHKDAKIWIVEGSMYTQDSGSGNGLSWIETGNIRIISCYMSPNQEENELEDILESLSECIRQGSGKEILIGGDFNAKSPLWGSLRTDARGRIVAEWIASENLTILNWGGIPTFRRRDQESHLDITVCSSSLGNRIKWKILDNEETGSDHQYIEIEIEEQRRRETRQIEVCTGWNVKTFEKERFTKSFRERNNESEIETAERLIKVVREACQSSMKQRYKGKRKGAYWWNNEIKEKRAKCIKIKRQYTRERKKNATGERCEMLYEQYKENRELLKKEMKNAKENQWKHLCDDLERDIWGKAYKIVMKRIGKKLPVIPPDTRKEIIEGLFPDHPVCLWTCDSVDVIQDFELDELLEAVLNVNIKKAPGPDNIPPRVVKETVLAFPQSVLRVFNTLLQQMNVPKIWKEARVALVPKPVKIQGAPPTYRPICLLNTFGKLYEKMILNRLLKEIEEKSLLSEKQYGFMPGRSTVQAILRVVGLAKEELSKTWRTRNHCLLIAIDIRNAFNSAPWLNIIVEMEKKGISKYLINIFKSYLSERELVGEEFKKEMTAGVCQGSTAGPTLWNILYDGVLEQDLMPEGVELVAYADDLAVVVKARNEGEMERKANTALERIHQWMESKGLEIAPEKTEATLLNGRKKCRPLIINIMGTNIPVKKEIKYLGVVLDKGLSFGPHINHVTGKADRAHSNLTRIMPTIGGVGQRKRAVLAGVTESIILYAAPVWVPSLRFKKYREVLIREQRKTLIRVCRAYRTVSNEALTVIAGIPPLDLKAEERASSFGKSEREREGMRDATMTRWQERWNRTEKGQWTRKLIRDVKAWTNRRHGEVNYHMTQVLSGHGCFGEYLYRFKKRTSSLCEVCQEKEDTPEHTLFECEKWKEAREELHLEIRAENMIEVMLASEEGWGKVERYVTSVMKEKERIEREIERTTTENGRQREG